MKKIVISLLCGFSLVACGQAEKSQVAELNKEEIAEQLQIGNSFSITNETQYKNIRLKAFETNLSEKGTYYYQLEIQNLGSEPIHIKAKQIELIDRDGNTYRVKLIDRELTQPFEGNQTKTGIIAFDQVENAEPQFIKLKD